MDIHEDLPAELARVHLLVWLQSAVGPILVGAGILLPVLRIAGTPAIGIVGCTILWLFAFAPLRTKARAIPIEARVPAPDAPRWLVRAAGIGQLVCGVSMFLSLWGLLILPANLLVGAVIFIRIMACQGMDLPTQRQRWGNLLLILIFGSLVNAVVAAMALSAAMKHW